MESIEHKIRHLEMIQAVVARLARNSFLIKGWSIALGSAIYAAAIYTGQSAIALVGSAAVCIFWLLDAYYLRTERLFRSLYDMKRCAPDNSPDFSLNYQEAVSHAPKTLLTTACTATQVGLHLPIVLAGLAIAAILAWPTS